MLTDLSQFVQRRSGLRFIQIEGETQPAHPSGRLNRQEAAAVVSEVTSLAVSEPDTTIGVVTPFRAQADLIRRMLRTALSNEVFTSGRLRVGTAHAFQGDQRDVMVFSLVLSRGAPDGSADWVEEQRNLINVAVGRAKRLLVVVGDAPRIESLPGRILLDLVRYAQGGQGEVRSTDHPVLARARGRLASACPCRRVSFDADVAGYWFPVVVTQGDGRRVYVDIDAFAEDDDGASRHLQLLRRDAILTRAGYAIARVPAWRCLEDPLDVLQEILAVPAADIAWQ